MIDFYEVDFTLILVTVYRDWTTLNTPSMLLMCAEVMPSDRFACHSVCVQEYCKYNELISLQLDVTTEPTSRKNWLTFGGDAVSDMDFGSLFHFADH